MGTHAVSQDIKVSYFHRLRLPHGLLLGTLFVSAMTSLAIANPAEKEKVWIVRSEPSRFSIAMGSFVASYDSKVDAGLKITRGNESEELSPETPGLEILAAGGTDFQPLEGNTVQGIEYDGTDSHIFVRITSQRDWADFVTTFVFFIDHPGMIAWQVEVTVRDRRVAIGTDFDARFLHHDVQLTDLGGPHPAQVPVAFYFEKSIDSTLFFYADYSQLNDYFRATRTRPVFCLGADLRVASRGKHRAATDKFGVGYWRPLSDLPLPVGKRIVVGRTFCRLDTGLPEDEIGTARRFLEALGSVYTQMTQPRRCATDWPDVARRELKDLQLAECWGEPVLGRAHLLPYVNHRDRFLTDLKTESQILGPLVILNHRFPDWGFQGFQKILLENVKQYYVPERKMIHNSVGPVRNSYVKDNVYPAQNTILLGNAILNGVDDPELKAAFIDFVDTIIRVGRQLDYQFPNSVEWPSGRVVDDSFWQYEVGGAFAYVLLQCYEMTGEQRYLSEAKRAVESIKGHGFDLPHQLDTAAAGAAACCWLYNLTGERHYLDLSLIPMANVFRRCWFWESDYDFAQYYNTFFGVSFASNAPQIAPTVQIAVRDYFLRYYKFADADILPALDLLVPEFCKHTTSMLRFFYPPLVDPRAVSPGPASWPVSPGLYIALEDMSDGSRKLGTAGQGIYMSRAALELAASYRNVGPIQVGCEYPVKKIKWIESTNEAHIFIGGVKGQLSRIDVQSPRSDLENWTATLNLDNGTPLELEVEHLSPHRFLVITPGGSEVVLSANPLKGVVPKFHAPAELRWQAKNDSKEKPAALQCYWKNDPPDCVERCRPYRVTLEIKNPSSANRRVKISTAQPDSWQSSVIEPIEVVLLPGGIKPVPITWLATSNATMGFHFLDAWITEAGRKQQVVQRVEIVETQPGVIDLGNDASLWKSPDSQSVDIAVRSDGNQLYFGPKSHGFGFRRREVCVDLDEYPVLSIEVERTDALWALFLDDGRQFPELGVRHQQETWQTGVFHYDIPKITGWHGVKRFEIRFVISQCKEDRIVNVGWLTVDKIPHFDRP